MIDLAAVRADTPACANLLHFNNAGASLMPQPVFAAVRNHIALERDVGGYEAAALALDELNGFYDVFARLLSAGPEEIAYVENATRAWDMAFYALRLCEGDRILTHESEYASNYLAYLQLARRRGVVIDLVPSDGSGQLDVEAMPALITSKTKLVAITHVPSQGGLVNPVAEVGRIAREHGLTYLLDACQSAGQLDLDVGEIGCQLLSGTGRKFLRGPRGTGFLYVSSAIVDRLDPPFIDLHSANWTGPASFEFVAGAKRFENFESFVAGRIGLAKAAGYALALGIGEIEARVRSLGEMLRERLAEIPGVRVRDRGSTRCGIVTFDKDGESPESIVERLRARHINISFTPASYAQLDLGERGLRAVARASVHYFNTEDEIEHFCRAVLSL